MTRGAVLLIRVKGARLELCEGTLPRVHARPASRLGLSPNARHLLDLHVKPLVTERLALIESKTNIVDGCTIELGTEQRTISWRKQVRYSCQAERHYGTLAP